MLIPQSTAILEIYAFFASNLETGHTFDTNLHTISDRTECQNDTCYFDVGI